MNGPRRLLVVDDEPGFADLVQRVAEGLGYEATALSDARQFRAVYARVRPDVIVLDMVMPDVEGMELVRWLSDAGCTARILVISGYNPYYAKLAHDLGSVGGLQIEAHAKPIGLARLRELLA
ncbi:MAG TPA: response regulator [Alphaproteobacteria bacterium]|jgi:DNA-binding response OmpR family regulator|nr:response regulator [Alphaproteobacteria bacterium]